MRKLLAALVCSISIAGAAQDGVKADKTVICYPVKVLLKDLRDKYHEEPMIVGKHLTLSKVATAVYVNRETGSYTVLELDDEAACIISMGTDVHYRFPKTQPTT